LKQAEKTALANQKKGAEFLEIMKKTLSSSKSVSGIFGYGMYFSISFNKKLDLENIFKVLIKKGFIIGVIGDKIRLAPPFDTTKETWQRLVNDIKEVIE
jgi:acetylornithine/succinyldiaminopimelate/putrescine aminotransferase